MATEVSRRGRKEVSAATTENLSQVSNAYEADADIYSTEDGLTLYLDLPGVEKGAVSIELDESNTLQIKGKSAVQEPGGLQFREFQVGDFYRSFRLGEEYDRDKVSATLEDGVLKVDVPKREESKPKRIAINA